MIDNNLDSFFPQIEVKTIFSENSKTSHFRVEVKEIRHGGRIVRFSVRIDGDEK